MGNQNVRRVLLAQPALPLPPGTRYCLALMAMVAHDDTRLYWAGHDWLALAMGYRPGPTGLREVRRHLALLEKAGYVERLGHRRGKHYQYELHLPG